MVNQSLPYFRLLDLPPEVQIMIYKYYFRSEEVTVRIILRVPIWDATIEREYDHPGLSPLLVACKRIHHLAKPFVNLARLKLDLRECDDFDHARATNLRIQQLSRLCAAAIVPYNHKWGPNMLNQIWKGLDKLENLSEVSVQHTPFYSAMSTKQEWQDVGNVLKASNKVQHQNSFFTEPAPEENLSAHRMKVSMEYLHRFHPKVALKIQEFILPLYTGVELPDTIVHQRGIMLYKFMFKPCSTDRKGKVVWSYFEAWECWDDQHCSFECDFCSQKFLDYMNQLMLGRIDSLNHDEWHSWVLDLPRATPPPYFTDAFPDFNDNNSLPKPWDPTKSRVPKWDKSVHSRGLVGLNRNVWHYWPCTEHEDDTLWTKCKFDNSRRKTKAAGTENSNNSYLW